MDQPAASEEIFELVVALSRRLQGDLEAALARLDLTPPQAMLLRQLGDAMPMKDAAGRLHCDPSNVTGIVDRLEGRGLVERQSTAGDRRVKHLVLTDEGRRMRDEVDRVVGTFSGLASLAESERDSLRDSLVRALGQPTAAGLVRPEGGPGDSGRS